VRAANNHWQRRSSIEVGTEIRVPVDLDAAPRFGGRGNPWVISVVLPRGDGRPERARLPDGRSRHGLQGHDPLATSEALSGRSLLVDGLHDDPRAIDR